MLRRVLAGVVLVAGLHASHGEVRSHVDAHTAKGLALLAAKAPKGMRLIEQEKLAQKKHVGFLATKAKVKSAAQLKSEYEMREEKALHAQHEGKTGHALFARAQQVFERNFKKNLAKRGLSYNQVKEGEKKQAALEKWRAKAALAKRLRIQRRAQKKANWAKAHPQAAKKMEQKKQQSHTATHRWRGRKHGHRQHR
eukprot:TRINITY_DN578_c0_g1_i3.p1 TRINITY_DN578_c0_g1~~TRINITY_DN578_c0_g1_i3.p1  ORF type:complete len:196 (+),score=48.21 TRINITY_DN578_c0_g1_i3:95-682(+)